MAEAIFPPAHRRDLPQRERNSACAVCGWPQFCGIHLPALTGPRKGKPWDHAYVAPSAGVPGNSEGWPSPEFKAAFDAAAEPARTAFGSVCHGLGIVPTMQQREQGIRDIQACIAGFAVASGVHPSLALKLWCSDCGLTTWALTLEVWKTNYRERCPACGGEITKALAVPSGVSANGGGDGR